MIKESAAGNLPSGDTGEKNLRPYQLVFVVFFKTIFLVQEVREGMVHAALERWRLHCSCGAQTWADYMKLICRKTGALVLGQAGLDEGIAELWAASWRSGTNLTHDVHSLLRGILSYDPLVSCRLVSVVDSALLLFYWIFDHCVFIYSSSNTESHNFSHSS